MTTAPVQLRCLAFATPLHRPRFVLLPAALRVAPPLALQTVPAAPRSVRSLLAPAPSLAAPTANARPAQRNFRCGPLPAVPTPRPKSRTTTLPSASVPAPVFCRARRSRRWPATLVYPPCRSVLEV